MYFYIPLFDALLYVFLSIIAGPVFAIIGVIICTIIIIPLLSGGLISILIKKTNYLLRAKISYAIRIISSLWFIFTLFSLPCAVFGLFDIDNLGYWKMFAAGIIQAIMFMDYISEFFVEGFSLPFELRMERERKERRANQSKSNINANEQKDNINIKRYDNISLYNINNVKQEYHMAKKDIIQDNSIKQEYHISKKDIIQDKLSKY